MFTYSGKTALITGASSGIGEEFARTLAARGMNLILVARSEEKLSALAAELSEQHKIRTDVITADLSRDGEPEKVYSATQQRDLTVDLLINNAGFATYGHFDVLSTEREHDEVMLNVVAVVDLTHAFLPAMLQQRDGGVINVASNAAFQAVPYMAVYAASKAFVLSFSEALWAEYRRQGLRVLGLCPGATATQFFEAVGSENAAFGNKHTPQQVVAVALKAFEQGRSYVIEGRSNYLLAQLSRFVPRSLAARVSKLMMRPRKNAKSALQAR